MELDFKRAEQACRNSQTAGAADTITQRIGDARELLQKVPDSIELLFLDGGFGNYYPCLRGCMDRLSNGAVLVADNAGIGAAEMADYLSRVRQHCENRTEWFETDLAWNPRDAMEISVFRAQ